LAGIRLPISLPFMKLVAVVECQQEAWRPRFSQVSVSSKPDALMFSHQMDGIMWQLCLLLYDIFALFLIV